MKKQLYARHVEPRLKQALEDFPAVLIQGPRQCGKTTLVQTVGKTLGYVYFSFDDATVYQAARDDPMGFVNDLPERVILDEVQKVASIFSAIKLVVDRHRIAGRFILTGSVSVLHIRQITDSLAGRLSIINLHPLSQCEIEQTAAVFLDNLFAGKFAMNTQAVSKKNIIARMTKGGYPDALKISSEHNRVGWYHSYIDALIRHDVPDISAIHSLDTLSKIITLSATRTAQLFNTNNMAKSFQLSRTTIHKYLILLETIFMIKRLPAWHSNHSKRLIKMPKLHLNDTGVACSLTGLNQAVLHEDKNQWGQLLETFVFQELQRQESGDLWRHVFSHYRDKDGSEVDIVIQRDAASLVGVEVKASATIKKTDWTGLCRLKKATGKRFKGGVIIYAGESCVPFGDKLYAVPVRLLWEGG